MDRAASPKPKGCADRSHGDTRPARTRLLAGASIVVFIAFVALLQLGALPLLPDPASLRATEWWAVALCGVLWLLVTFLKTARWWWLLAPIHRLPLHRVILVGLVGLGAIVVLPFRTGELVRPALIRKEGSVSGWAATGTVAAERIIDGFVLSVLLFFALSTATLLDPLPDHIGEFKVSIAMVPRATYAALALFSAALVTMTVFFVARDWARRLTLRVVGLVSERFAVVLASALERLAEGFRFLPEWRYSAPFVATTVAYWLLSAAGVWVLGYGCGFQSIHYAQAGVALGVLSLGILVPNAPGFFGAYQLSLYSGLAMFLPPDKLLGQGAAIVFFLYLLHVGITLLLSAMALLALAIWPPPQAASAPCAPDGVDGQPEP